MNDSLKVIVRCLPPDMIEEDFLQEFFDTESCADLTKDVLWYFFVKGRQNTVAFASGESTDRRSQEETVRTGYSFVYFDKVMSLNRFVSKNLRKSLQDKRGNVFVSNIEYSPVQRMPLCKFVYRNHKKEQNQAHTLPLSHHSLEDDTDFREYKHKSMCKEADAAKTVSESKEAKEKVIQWLESKLKQEAQATELVRDLAQLWKTESTRDTNKGSKKPKKAASEKKNESLSKKGRKKKQSKAHKAERIPKSEKPSLNGEDTGNAGSVKRS